MKSIVKIVGVVMSLVLIYVVARHLPGHQP
jgi:hypothetical protein